MKAFVFRLESVLQLRAREEEKVRELFSQAEHRRALAAAARATAEAGLLECEAALTQARTGRTSGADQMLFLHAMHFHRDACARATAALRTAEGEAAARRDVWLAARRKHEALARLKERYRQAHETALRRHEEAEIGDLITSRHGRRIAAGSY